MKYRSANLSEFALHCEGLIGKGYVFHDLYIATRRGRRVYEGVFKKPCTKHTGNTATSR